MPTYAEQAAELLETLDDAAHSIQHAQSELAGQRVYALEALDNIRQARLTLDAAERQALGLVRAGGERPR